MEDIAYAEQVFEDGANLPSSEFVRDLYRLYLQCVDWIEILQDEDIMQRSGDRCILSAVRFNCH